MHLGFFEIRNILLAVSVMNLIKMNKVFEKFKPQDFWKHTIAYVSNIFVRRYQFGNPGDNYLPRIDDNIGQFLNIDDDFFEK
jgi:hypothetical protein